MKRTLLIATLTGVLGACTHKQADAPLVKAMPMEKEIKTEYVEVPSPRPLPGQLKPLPRKYQKSVPVPVVKGTKNNAASNQNSDKANGLTLAEKAADEKTIEETLQSLTPASGNDSSKDVVAAANAKAVVAPEEEGFINSIMVYDYMEGALYQLYAAPQHITSIMLQPGEKLMSVASGDTVRWVVNDIMSGTGDNQKVHVLVKPVKPGLATNILITTDKRVYNIEAHSDAETYMASLSWNYPQSTIIRNQEATKTIAGNGSAVDTQVQLSALHFGYTVDGKDNIPWKPERVFDDGLKTYIEFPATLKAYEAPVLFISTSANATQLVNYRKKGDFYIVDRLFDKAELRVGEKKQDIITIRRQGA